MWPFKKARPKAPSAEDLSPAELAWLQEQRTALSSLTAAAGLSPPSEGRELHAADDLIRWWHTLPESDRPDPNPIVNAAGVALGDALATEFGLQWKIITDAFGTDLGLWWSGRGHVILSPTHSVAKKFADNPGGFVSALHQATRPDVQRMQAEMS